MHAAPVARRGISPHLTIFFVECSSLVSLVKREKPFVWEREQRQQTPPPTKIFLFVGNFILGDLNRCVIAILYGRSIQPLPNLTKLKFSFKQRKIYFTTEGIDDVKVQ